MGLKHVVQSFSGYSDFLSRNSKNYNRVSRNSRPSIRKQMYVCIKIKFTGNMQQMIQNVFLLKSCALEKEKLKRNSLEVKKSIFDFLLLQQYYPV